ERAVGPIVIEHKSAVGISGVKLRFPVLAEIDAEFDAVFALNFGEAFQNLKYIQRALDAAVTAEVGDGGEGNSRQDFARCVGGEIAWQTKNCRVIAERKVGLRFDKAGPVQTAIDEKSGSDRVDVVEGEAPVEPLQVIAR